MDKFLKKTALLALPLFLWAAFVLMVDPFNYFENHWVDDQSKQGAQKLNTLLYRTLDYMNDPCENMLIGDSRTNALPIDSIQEITGKDWKKLNTNAAKLNEIFDLFYMANERKKINHVVIGVNFNMFNKFGYKDRVSGLKKMMDNPLMYLFNKDVGEATFLSVKQMLSGDTVSATPQMDKDAFWKWNIETKAMHWYGKYEFPDSLYKELLEFDDFTKKNKIEVTFIITPHHKEFRDRLVEFELIEEEKRFKRIMSQLNARVIDFDFENKITSNRSNFEDPVHYNHEIGELIVREVFQGNMVVGKELQP